MQLFKFINLLLIGCSFIFFTSNSEAREPLPPRFSANAYTGVYTVGQADLMVSLDGDQQHNLYVDPQGAYGTDEQWYGDVGLGYRWITNDAAIIGGYLFAGHSQVENESGFWIVNPGLEVMGRRWDARVNAYIPVAGRSHALGQEELNTVSTPFFTGHTEVINSVFNIDNAIQQIGNGADARVGYQLFTAVPLKGYLGAYFFSITNVENVRGGAAGMEYWFDENIRVFANYSYDNYQHSKVVGGLGISFGGVRKGHWADPSLSERLTDPVERYLANLGHGSGIPSKTVLYAIGRGSRNVLVSNNIAFFSQTGTNTGGNLTLANCTFENPCGPNDFNQAGVNTLNSLLPNTQLFFNGGTYFANNGINPRTLNNGQSIHSRTTDYSAPANDSARSTFGGGFILSGNNLLENIILIPLLGNVPQEGVRVNGANNQIRGSDIGSVSNRYNFAVDDFGLNTLVDTVDIFANQIGVTTTNTNITILNSVIDVNTASGVGISATGGSVSFIDSEILGVGSGAFGISGIRTGSNSMVNVINSIIDVSNDVGSGNVIALENNSGDITVIGSTLDVEGTNVFITTGNPVNITETECMVNGEEVACT